MGNDSSLEVTKMSKSLAGERARTLELLLSVHADGGITVVDAVIHHQMPKLQQRAAELKRLGWDVRTRDLESGEVAYSVNPASPVGRADSTLAGCTLRMGEVAGWTSRTHREAVVEGTIPEHVLREAEEEALRAYRRVVEPWLHPDPEWLDEVLETLVLA